MIETIAAPLGSYDNPLVIDFVPTPERYPEQFRHLRSIWVLPPDGIKSKWYRSYGDYCD